MNHIERTIQHLNREYRQLAEQAAQSEESFDRARQHVRAFGKNIEPTHIAQERLWEEAHGAGTNEFYFMIGYEKSENPRVILKPFPKTYRKNHIIPIPEFNEKHPGIELGSEDKLAIANKKFTKIKLAQENPEELTKAWQEKTNARLEEITRQESKLQEALQKIDKKNEKCKERFAEQIDNINKSRTFLNLHTLTANLQPQITKRENRLDEKPFYSLWIGQSPVFLYDGQNVHYLHTRNKNKPLEARTTPAERTLGERKTLSEKLLGLKPNTFIDEKGYVLIGQQEETAARIFEQVFTGIEILPDEDLPSGYKIGNKPRGEGQETQQRHWSQTYLAQKRPERATQGQLLGSGGSYKAYTFGNKTAVEFDQEGRATYLFDTNFFENLRTWQRTELLTAQPEGFQGRIIHKENREEWMKQIDSYLA